METYQALNINQRINCKANCLIHYHRMNLGYVVRKHPDLFGYNKLLLEAPGIHNNRNYDGPGDNYLCSVTFKPPYTHNENTI